MMLSQNTRSPSRTAVATFVSLLILTAGCTVHFVSNYDQVTDQTATNLQMKVDTFLEKMQSSAGTPAGEYAQNKAFYEEMQGSTQALLSRAEAIPLNSFTVTQIQALRSSLDDLQKLHEQAGTKGLTPALAGPARTALDSNFKAIIKLEDAKKRGA